MKKGVGLLVFFFIQLQLFEANLYSQGETNNWIFGRSDKWLEFSTGSPIPIIPNMMLGGFPPPTWNYSQVITYNYFFGSYRNAATISDKSGNLLFYANGETIYHRQLDTLWTTNSTVIDRTEAFQSIFIPKPGSSIRFYYITPSLDDLADGIHYTELDISLNNGIGGVIGTPNILLTSPSCSKVTATYHSNGKDIWILTHEINSNNFKAYLVTQQGISLSPIISSIGSIYPVNLASDWHYNDPVAGQMKFSPTGDKLIVCIMGLNLVQIFKFNKTSGQVTSTIASFSILNPSNCEFSPDGTVAYIGIGYGSNPLGSQYKDTNAVYQVNLMAGYVSQVNNSVYKLNPNNDNNIEFNSLQLTFSGNIFVVDDEYDDRYKLNLISEPNRLEDSCSFIQYANDFTQYPLITPAGFSFFPSFFPPYLDRNILFANNCLNDSVLICTQTNTNFDSIRWEFTDPNFGLISIPNQDTIYHQFPGFGPYEISLKRYRNSGHLDLTKKLLYIYPSVYITLPQDTLLCPGSTAMYAANSDSCEFAWVNNFSIDTVYSPAISINSAGKYWPIITNFDNYCGWIDTIQVNFQQDNLNLGPDSFHLCSNPGFLLDASVNDSTALFNWNTGDTNSTLWVNTDGIYSVSVQQGNCIFQDTVALAFDDSLLLSMPDSVVLCDGIGTWLSAGDFNASYYWSPTGETSMDIWIDSAGIYSVTVSNGCGSFIDITEFIVPEIPVIDLGIDTAICEGTSLLINAFFPHSTFHWNTGSTNSYIESTMAGIYAVTVSNICGSDSDTISLAIEYPNTVNLGSDTIVCLQDNFILETGIVQGNILWSTGDSSQQITVTNSGNYAVSVSNACGMVEDNIQVTVLDVPEINLPVDTHICNGNHILLYVSSPQATYAWSTGSSNASIVTNDPGVYSVTISNICGIASDSIEVVVDDSLYIELGADTTVCLETNFMLQSSQTANQYLWSTGESSNEIAILQTGEYWLLASNACNTSSDTVSVIVNENTFAFEVDTLSLDSSLVVQLDAPLTFQNYLWSTNETSQSIEITNPGEFWLMVTDSVGCTATDTIIILPYISISELFASSIRLYPNPTTGDLNVNGLIGEETVEIYDILGKKLLSMHSKTSTLKLNLSLYSEGIYLLKIKSHGQVFSARILKE